MCITRHTFIFLTFVESLLVLLEGFGLHFSVEVFYLFVWLVFLALGEAERIRYYGKFDYVVISWL